MASFKFVLVGLGFVCLWVSFVSFCFVLFSSALVYFFTVLTRPSFVFLLQLTLSQPTKTFLLYGGFYYVPWHPREGVKLKSHPGFGDFCSQT